MAKKRLNSDKNLQAYVIGLALGDGNLSNPNNRAVRLRITCDAKYPFLIGKISKAIKDLLPDNKVSIESTPRKCVNISCYSNQWPALLGWNADRGSKFKQKVSVPKWIFKSEIDIRHCLKGLLETDGSVYYDRGYPMVMFVTIISKLAEDAEHMFRTLGFNSKVYILRKQKNPLHYNQQVLYHVRLSRDVNKFLKVIALEKR